MFLRIKILIILLFFIQSRLAQGFNIHYCGKLVADFSYLHNAEGCDMHDSKFSNNYQISEKTCCQDKVYIFDKNQIETESKIILLFNPPMGQTFFGDILHVNKFALIKIPEFPPPKLRAFKKNCAFIFYG